MYNRHSIRLRNYDYSSYGWYFVTICTQDRINYFRNVGVDRCVDPNGKEMGNLINYWWQEIPKHFKNVFIDEFMVMPNHLHGIIIIKNVNNRADTSVRPYMQSNKNVNVGVDRCVDPIKLGKIIQWFKTMTTNEYLKNRELNNWPYLNKRLWQRNYFERIIRNQKELEKIREYIRLNLPAGRQVL